MQRNLFMLMMTVCLAAAVFAQPDPNAPFQPQQPPAGRRGGMMGGGMMNMNALANQNPAEMLVLPQGLFILRSGVLAKFTAETLQPAGTLELFGALPAQPALPQNPTQQDREAMRDWMMANVARYAPAATLAQDDRLYIVAGSTFFRVNPATLQIDAKADLGEANIPPRMLMQAGAPQMKLENGVLYIIFGQELLAVKPDTGVVTGRAPLPAAMFPAPPGQMGGAFGGFGGNGPGNRGGRNGQQ